MNVARNIGRSSGVDHVVTNIRKKSAWLMIKVISVIVHLVQEVYKSVDLVVLIGC